MRIRPYLYPLLVGAVPSTGTPQTAVRTVTATIPANTQFVWTHTLNGTLQTAAGTTSVRVIIFDSKNGPLFNEPIETVNVAGAIYQTFAAAPRDLRPFPLPETHTFLNGTQLTATYTVILTPNGGDPAFSSVGIILCGFRIIEDN